MAKVSPLYLTHTSLFFLPAPIFCIFQGQRKSKKLIEPYVNFWLSHLYLLKVFFTCLTMTDFPFNRWFKSFKWRSSCCESFSVNYHHHFSWQTCSMELSSPSKPGVFYMEKRGFLTSWLCTKILQFSVKTICFLSMRISVRQGVDFYLLIQFSRDCIKSSRLNAHFLPVIHGLAICVALLPAP